MTVTTSSSNSTYAGHLSNGDPTSLSKTYKPTHPELFEVQFEEGSYNSSLVTKRSFSKGEVLCPLGDRSIESKVKRYSTVQVGEDQHIELCSDLLYINHSCTPSVHFSIPLDSPSSQWQVIALQDIPQGTPLSFFYPSTEWSMAQPFPCNCNTSRCLGMIRGAKDIEQEKLESWTVNEHILKLKGEQVKEGGQ